MLARVNPPYPWNHFFNEARTHSDYEHALREIERRKFRLLMDDPSTGVAGGAHEQAFYERFRRDLETKGWREHSRESGWLVWQRPDQ
jgi:hypothetical protein